MRPIMDSTIIDEKPAPGEEGGSMKQGRLPDGGRQN